MARFSAPDCRPVLSPVKARPCGRPAAGLDRSCAPAVIWRRRRIGAQQDQLNQSVHGSRGTPRITRARLVRMLAVGAFVPCEGGAAVAASPRTGGLGEPAASFAPQ